MIINTCFKKLVGVVGIKRFDLRFLSNEAKPIESNLKVSTREKIEKFFNKNNQIQEFKDLLPPKLLRVHSSRTPDYVYLVCPFIAKKIAKQIIGKIQGKNQIIAETNPGFGLITKALLQERLSAIRLYELNSYFQDYLYKYFKGKKKVALYSKDWFSLGRYAYMDNLDQGNRVQELLEEVPKKSWRDDPVMSVIGTVTNTKIIHYLIKSIILQRDVATYGRIDLFLVTYDRLCKIFTAAPADKLYYKPLSILTQILFETDVIDKYPRDFFMPWEKVKRQSRKTMASESDNDHLYLIRMTMRKEFLLNADHLVPFYCFVTTLYGKGSKPVIPTCEKWIPDCGEVLLLPKLHHKDYYEAMDIFTKFNELNTRQIIAVFRELSVHPNYASSPFMDMVEQEWLKTETIDTDLHDAYTKDA